LFWVKCAYTDFRHRTIASPQLLRNTATIGSLVHVQHVNLPPEQMQVDRDQSHGKIANGGDDSTALDAESLKKERSGAITPIKVETSSDFPIDWRRLRLALIDNLILR
jgi:hypothetical protein